eukprot:1324751-Amphidinium_carterae.1
MLWPAGSGMRPVWRMCSSTMAVACGARSRPALCTTYFTSVRLGTELGESRTSLYRPTFLPACCTMVWCRLLVLASRFGRKFKLWICQATLCGSMAVDVRAPNDSPFRTCSWAVMGRGVLVQARLTGPAQSVYRAELLALVTALQGSEPGALVVSDCKRGCRGVQQLWAGQRKPRGVHRALDLEQRLLTFPRLGREVKWIKAHTDRRTAVQHGVTEVDRQGNERADKAANTVLAPVDGKQSTWEKLLARPQPPGEDNLIEDFEWPYDFEGHTLTRETAGLRCLECGKGVSDIAGRPRWSYFREFRCSPKRRRGRPRRALHHEEPLLLDETGATQVRPGRARPRARSEGLAGPLQMHVAQEPLVRPGFPASRDLSLLRETQDSL